MATPLSLRVFESEARVYRRTWRGSVISSFLNPILYLAAMGVGLGSLVDANLPDGVEGISYLTYLAPGLLVATAMQTGAGEGAWKVMAGIKWVKTYHAKLATPIGIPSLVAGHLLWSGARVLMVPVVFAVIMTAFRVAPIRAPGAGSGCGMQRVSLWSAGWKKHRCAAWPPMSPADRARASHCRPMMVFAS